ncbi:hypothetical protein [Vibrio sp. SCSIO 43137]|uniref:hypothetical protein n=1 Tax=Vibrio sp. SCSIO 43137 TaxID=3021011 RepID=UPI0023076891|nr:hypothetical protein [Vibrio sp. SCSIO 43137]WCE32638.1 hypothetical protein PK654_19305 [Vibrio sp. SCSIO 43137]WCE32645.1 hypothetical protein PK654_19340 [Vibrio sp. SCSIO 43137]
MKVYYDASCEEMISTFTPDEGWYTFKSLGEMHQVLSFEHGDDLELIELTPELHKSMLDAGDFDGYEP